MKVAIGSDHAGFELKEYIKTRFESDGYEFVDCGTHSKDSTDYPDYAFCVGKKVAKKECELGILVCSTGIGMSIAANKVTGVRAAHCTDMFSAKMTRRHNNANVLTLGQNITGISIAEEIVRLFLTEEFEGDRHERRVNKIDQFSNKEEA